MKQTLKHDESAPVRSPHVESVLKKQRVLRDEWEKEICQSNLTRDGCQNSRAAVGIWVWVWGGYGDDLPSPQTMGILWGFLINLE